MLLDIDTLPIEVTGRLKVAKPKLGNRRGNCGAGLAAAGRALDRARK